MLAIQSNRGAGLYTYSEGIYVHFHIHRDPDAPPPPSLYSKGEKWFPKGTNIREIYHRQALGTAAVKILDILKCHDVPVPTKIRIVQAVLFSMEVKIGL